MLSNDEVSEIATWAIHTMLSEYGRWMDGNSEGVAIACDCYCTTRSSTAIRVVHSLDLQQLRVQFAEKCDAGQPFDLLLSSFSL